MRRKAGIAETRSNTYTTAQEQRIANTPDGSPIRLFMETKSNPVLHAN